MAWLHVNYFFNGHYFLAYFYSADLRAGSVYWLIILPRYTVY